MVDASVASNARWRAATLADVAERWRAVIAEALHDFRYHLRIGRVLHCALVCLQRLSTRKHCQRQKPVDERRSCPQAMVREPADE
jgi:hypothetical protein